MAGSIIANNSATLKTNSDGRAVRVCLTGDQVPLPVSSSPFLSSGIASINTYTEITAVAVSTETDIVTYTVPALKKAQINWIEASGDNIGIYRVKLNGTTIAKRRTYIGGDANETFPFGTYELVAGDILKVTIENCSLDLSVGEFDARINGIEVTA